MFSLECPFLRGDVPRELCTRNILQNSYFVNTALRIYWFDWWTGLFPLSQNVFYATATATQTNSLKLIRNANLWSRNLSRKDRLKTKSPLLRAVILHGGPLALGTTRVWCVEGFSWGCHRGKFEARESRLWEAKIRQIRQRWVSYRSSIRLIRSGSIKLSILGSLSLSEMSVNFSFALVMPTRNSHIFWSVKTPDSLFKRFSSSIPI